MSNALVIVGCFFVLLAQANAQDSTSTREIESLAAKWESAWNARDAAGMTSLLADDIDFVTVLGPKGWLKGRKQFEEVHARMFTTYFKESTWKNNSTHVKFIRPDLAIMRVLWQTTGDKVRHRKHGELREGIFTWVTEKREGKWVIIASQNTENMPILGGNNEQVDYCISSGSAFRVHAVLIRDVATEAIYCALIIFEE